MAQGLSVIYQFSEHFLTCLRGIQFQLLILRSSSNVKVILQYDIIILSYGLV